MQQDADSSSSTRLVNAWRGLWGGMWVGLWRGLWIGLWAGHGKFYEQGYEELRAGLWNGLWTGLGNGMKRAVDRATRRAIESAMGRAMEKVMETAMGSAVQRQMTRVRAIRAEKPAHSPETKSALDRYAGKKPTRSGIRCEMTRWKHLVRTKKIRLYQAFTGGLWKRVRRIDKPIGHKAH